MPRPGDRGRGLVHPACWRIASLGAPVSHVRRCRCRRGPLLRHSTGWSGARQTVLGDGRCGLGWHGGAGNRGAQRRHPDLWEMTVATVTWQQLDAGIGLYREPIMSPAGVARNAAPSAPPGHRTSMNGKNGGVHRHDVAGMKVTKPRIRLHGACCARTGPEPLVVLVRAAWRTGRGGVASHQPVRWRPGATVKRVRAGGGAATTKGNRPCRSIW